jgi:hypothetical protein
MSQINLVKHDYKGNTIAQREKDSYVNLTQMCATEGRKVSDYLRQDSTKEYLDALSTIAGIPAIRDSASTPALVNRTRQGIWAHPEVAIDCAMWVSVDLRIWANRTLVQIIKHQSETPLPQVTTTATKALPCPEITLRSKIVRAVDNYVQLFKASHSQVWTAIYRDLKYTYHYDASARLKASGIKRSKLEQVEADGMLESMRSVAEKVLGAEI